MRNIVVFSFPFYTQMYMSSAGQHVPVQAALTLSDEAERSRPFASPMGQLMVTQRTSQAAAKQVHSCFLMHDTRSLTCSIPHPFAHSLTH